MRSVTLPQGSSEAWATCWWVNQGASYKEERDGGYIWAPQRTKDGRQLAHHHAVAKVREGDRIFHYSKGALRALGVATSDGYEAQRPSELSADAWEAAGFRADVEYDEFAEPIQLVEIPEALRVGAGGPFTSSGQITQGYLYETPPRVVEHLERLISSGAKGQQALAVYVGRAARPNLNHSLTSGTALWGWKQSQEWYDEVKPGDLLVLGAGFDGGSPRVQADQFLEHGLGQLIVARCTSKVFSAEDPYWPDETGGVVYPHRVEIEVLSDEGPVAIADLDARFGGKIAEGIRMSGITQGRGELVHLDRRIDVTPAEFSEVVGGFAADLNDSGLRFGRRHDEVARSFVVSLATKPFLILTGLSGSGKTQLALAFGKWLGKERLKVLAVRPDWTSPEALLGYENSLSEPIDGGYAWNAPEALRFILAAHQDPHHPYLLLLDEMNLAHVERYFADVLSGMESGEAIVPNLAEARGEWRKDAGPETVPLPPNLFIVGTVNVDETTYMFSPKVLDRANTIEFRVETDDLDPSAERPGDIARATPELAAGFLHASKTDPGPGRAEAELAEWVKKVHELLAEEGREFGHRTFHEIRLFARKMEAAGHADPLEALDLQLLQKVLPRLHGSRSELTELLNRLGSFCLVGPTSELDDDFDAADQPSRDAALPRSFDKIHRMARRLRSNHFVAFAE